MKNVLFAITLIASAVAFADNNGQFNRYDADQSGSVSAAEALQSAELAQNFSTLDQNADGQLTSDEFREFAAI